MPISNPSSPPPKNYTFFSTRFLLLSIMFPILASIAIYRLDTFDPALVPADVFAASISTPMLLNDHLMNGAEFIGVGLLDKPEDLAYHLDSGLIYTGCVDGWVKRVKVFESANDSVVEDWVNTGGRPLGIAFGLHGEVIVADADKGLLNISDDGMRTELLTEEAEGVRFKLTDAVDVANNGILYFTDASYKYTLDEFAFDILEGKPHGRLMSFDPTTKTTSVLLKDLYFANGVSMSPNHDFVVFCETPMSLFFIPQSFSSPRSISFVFLCIAYVRLFTWFRRRCSKYYIRGEKTGHVEVFIQGLPGYPDNIRYDGEGHYWIGMPSAVTMLWKLSMKHPFLRKITAIAAKYGLQPMFMKNAGVLQVDLDGKPVALYHDHTISHISTGLKIGNHLYCGSLLHNHITRLNLDQYPARAAT